MTVLCTSTGPQCGTGEGYADPDTGWMLPTRQEALYELVSDSEAQPTHVMRFGVQSDMRGIIAPSADAGRRLGP